MKVCFNALMFPDIENDLRNSKRPNSVSGHAFQANMIKGLDANLQAPVTVVNLPRIRRYPDYPKLVFRRQEFSHTEGAQDVHIGFVNLPALNLVTATISLTRELCRWAKSCNGEEAKLVIFNGTLPQLIALNFVKRRYPNVQAGACMGDLHGVYGVDSGDRGLKKTLQKSYYAWADHLSRKLDFFAFSTAPMAAALGMADKPFVVLEGLYDPAQIPQQDTSNTEEEKSLFYAGALHLDYGIAHLLRAFSLIEAPQYRLTIAGNGNAVPLIQEYAAKDSRITYLGLITPAQVKQRQAAACALISPRTSEREFVKYSFPSKTMECLASGKPYIAHKLPCDPDEYGQVIQYAQEETDASLRDKIVEICELPREERLKIGIRAKQFIKEEKNPAAMCKRIVELWNSVL